MGPIDERQHAIGTATRIALDAASLRRFAVAIAVALGVGDAHAQIDGVVRDAAGAPIEGAQLLGIDPAVPFALAAPMPGPVATTGPDGGFVLDRATAARWPALLVTAEGHAHVAVATERASSRPILLPPGRVLAGTVRSPAGEPLAGVRVEARDWLAVSPLFGDDPTNGFGEPEPRTAVVTDDRGTFVLRGVCEHALALVVGGDGFERRRFGPFSAGDPFDTRVASVPVVRVSVVDQEGQPLPGLAVQLWRTPGQGAATKFVAEERGRTDASGVWTFEWLEAETTIGVLADDGRWLASTELSAHEPTIELSVPNDSLHPEPAGSLIGSGRIRGIVVDPATGTGVAGATVGVVPGEEVRPGPFVHGDAALSQTLEPRATTGADGTFELSALPGPYSVAVAWLGHDQPGWRRNPTPVAVEVAEAAPTEGVRLELQRLVEGHGQIRATRPVAGLWVEAIAVPSAPTWRSRFAALDDEGAFAFEGLAPGSYALRVLASGGPRQTQPMELAGTTTHWPAPADIDLGDHVPIELTGRVTSNVPTQRLAVISMRPAELHLGRAGMRWTGSVGLVDRSGAFRCAELPGPRLVVVVDLATGAPLWATGHEDLEAADRTLDIAFEAHRLDVGLAESMRREAAWLAIVPAAGEQRPEVFGGLPEGRPYAFGLTTHRDREPPTLWLPEGRFEFALHGVRDGEALGKPVPARVGSEGERSIELRVP